MNEKYFDYNKLGALLKQSRERAGFTQNDIAVEFGVKYQTVSAWENGKNKIDIQMLFSLCEKYDIDFSRTLEYVTGNLPERNKAPTAEVAAEAMYEILYYYLGHPPTVAQAEALKNVLALLCKGIEGIA